MLKLNLECIRIGHYLLNSSDDMGLDDLCNIMEYQNL